MPHASYPPHSNGWQGVIQSDGNLSGVSEREEKTTQSKKNMQKYHENDAIHKSI